MSAAPIHELHNSQNSDRGAQMKKKYLPNTRDARATMGYLVEECGEVLAAVGKTLRHGLTSCNPELPIEEQETNRDWILRELKDLEHAIKLVRVSLGPEDGPR